MMVDLYLAHRQRRAARRYRFIAAKIGELLTVRDEELVGWARPTDVAPPQDWRQVVPIAKWIATLNTCDESRDAWLARAPLATRSSRELRRYLSQVIVEPTVSLDEVVAAVERVLPPLRLRPPIAPAVRDLLNRVH
jgi:hypothetical protein